jgi:dTDP-4-dehydrorhamnose reductase
MKILIIGGGGMLGHKLTQIFSGKFETFVTLRSSLEEYEYLKIFDKTTNYTGVDVENIQLIGKIVSEIKPDVIINAVGIIKQLPSAKNVIKTLTINSIFPHQLAEIAGKNRARLICISTDCVFSGRKGSYSETDVADAEDLYGKSKNLGEVSEENCLTVRTSIIGREIGTKHSLLEWFLSNEGGKVKGFKNAVFSGFPTIIAAEILADVIENQKHLSGLYHVSSEPINKFDLLNLIKKEYGANIEIEEDENFAIDRSLDSTKFRNQTGFQPQSWEKMIGKMAQDATPYPEWRK